MIAQPFPFCESHALQSKKLQLQNSLCPDGEIVGRVDKRSVQTRSEVCPARHGNRRNHLSRVFHRRSVCPPPQPQGFALPKCSAPPKRVSPCTKPPPPKR